MLFRSRAGRFQKSSAGALVLLRFLTGGFLRFSGIFLLPNGEDVYKRQIQDDAHNEGAADPRNSYTYKACPESVSKVEEQIREDEKNVTLYSLYNSG